MTLTSHDTNFDMEVKVGGIDNKRSLVPDIHAVGSSSEGKASVQFTRGAKSR